MRTTTHRRWIVAAAIAIGCVSTAPAAHALRAPREARPDAPVRDDTSASPLDRILDFQMRRMTRELRLTDEQADKIAPRVRRMAEAQIDARRQRQDLLRVLQDDTDAGNERRVRADLDRLRDHDDKSERRLDDMQRDITKELTPRQQAQYILFQERFTRELQRLVGEARRRGDDADRQAPEPSGPGSRRRSHN